LPEGLRRACPTWPRSRASSHPWDDKSVERLEALRTELVLDRLAVLPATRITLDFDGSVLGTGRRAEGAAVGFNKKKGRNCSYPRALGNWAGTARGPCFRAIGAHL